MTYVEPFLRWAGGKTWLIKEIDKMIGKLNYNRYFEPFLGGASVFFALQHNKKAYLSDINEELIDSYITIRDFPNEVIELFSKYKNTETDYYNIRELKPQTNVEKAARFIFLNQTSYNGLYRVNRKGEYNVPYGFRKRWEYDITRILNASQKLKKANLSSGDFELNKYKIQEKDLVFLDPPYTVSHNNNGFIEYNKVLFSLEDQHRLSRYINYVKKKGAYYILTNAAHVTIKEIFEKDDRRILVDRYSLIGGKNSKREKVSEYIFTNIPEEVGEYDKNIME
ncbi:DNA adenine methylase [Clostridium polynesiense]|uniref:DNA adenine methylase n=1 Tax=Clostridium polynesiense TaxID=1325933 RepID=UPI00058E1B52|nr:Dam family site-specific DNA-(adenine-N6)-methyltransferase [Clostridium polynesiense]